MTCVRCGSYQSEAGLGNRFCSNCGASLPASAAPDQPTYVQPPVYAAPMYDQGYDDAVPGLVAEPVAPLAPKPPAPERDWMRHPGTWVIAATALLVAGIVLAAVIISSGGSSENNKNQAAATPTTSSTASASAVAATPSTSAPPPSTATQTVIVVPATTGAPAETRTVTVAPRPTGNGGPLGDATPADTSYYQRGSTVYFDSPSHNIGCRLVAGGSQAQCTIKDYDFSDPGYDCPHGAGVLQNAGEEPVIDCVGSTYGGESTLDYGYYVSFGAFSCVSKSATGITCEDGSGNGFSISRETYTEY